MKQAWIENIPYVLAELDYQRLGINPTTPDGAYRAVLARTDDPERAERVKIAQATEAKLEMLRREGT